MQEPWLQLVSGRVYPVLNPKPSDFHIEDIAHALSNLCRFAGHVKTFYSIAQHSVLCAKHGPAETALERLLHDASEAYLVDIPRPLKNTPMMEGYRALEQYTEEQIACQFGLQFPYPPDVKEADNRALRTEQRDLMGRQVAPWNLGVEPYPTKIIPLPPEAAREQFLATYNRLTRERNARLELLSQSKAA